MPGGFSLSGELGIQLNQASVRAALKTVETQFRNVNATVNVSIDKRSIAGIEAVSKAAADLTKDLGRSAAAAKSLSQNLNLTKVGGEFRKAATESKNLTNSIKESGKNIDSLAGKVSSLARGLSVLGNTNLGNKFSGIDAAKVSVDKLTQSLTRASAAAKTLKQDLSSIGSIGSIGNGVKESITAISQLSAASKQGEKSLKGAADAAKSIKGGASQGAAAVVALTSEFELMGREAAFAARRLTAFTIAATGIYGFISALTSGIREAVAFEKQVVKIAQVNQQSVKSMKDLTDSVGEVSITLGVSRSELLGVAETLAQAGLSAKDTKVAMTALAKTELAPTFRNLTETTEGAISILNSFGNRVKGTGIQVKDLEGALGSINRVSADFAVESQDIIKAVRTAGAVFAASSKQTEKALGPLQEFIAVFTAVRDTTRESADSIATGLRTIFTRIQRPQTIEFLKQFGIQLTELEGGSDKFVGSYEAVKRIAEGLQDLDSRDIKFFRIAEELGGYRQISKVIPLVQQLAKAQKALGTAQQGEGSLNDDAVKAQESLANRFEKTRQAFLKLVYDLTQTNSFKGLAKGILSVADSLIGLASGFKEIVPYIAVFAALKTAAAGFQYLKGFQGGLSKGTAPDGSSVGLPGLSGKPTRELATTSSATNSLVSATTSNTVALNKLTLAIGRVNLGGLAAPKRFATGGVVGGNGRSDTILSLLTPGEGVLDRSTMQGIGGQGGLTAIKKYARGGASVVDLKGVQAYLKKIIGTNADVTRLTTGIFEADDLSIFNKSLSKNQKGAAFADGRIAQKRGSTTTTTFHELSHNFDRLLFENTLANKPEYANTGVGQRLASLVPGNPASNLAARAAKLLLPIKYKDFSKTGYAKDPTSAQSEGFAVLGEAYAASKNILNGIPQYGKFSSDKLVDPEIASLLVDYEQQLLPLMERVTQKGRKSFPVKAMARGGGVDFGRGPSLARVAYNPDDVKNQKKRLLKMFPGKSIQEAEGIIASIVGAPDDSVVSLGGEYYGRQDVKIGHPHIVAAHRSIDTKNKRIDNEFLKVADSAPEGFATQLLAKQVENASANGFKSLNTLAVGARDQDRNGYYTWARLGFDGKIPPLFNDVQDTFPGVTTVQELFAQKGGKEWWKENGRDFDGFFDLAPDSKNVDLLSKYIKERKKQGRGIPRFAEGGLVPGHGNTDSVPMELPVGSFVLRKKAVKALGLAKGGSVPAMVMPGEVIVPPDQASKIGLPRLTQMNQAQGFALGGPVGHFATGNRVLAQAQANNPGLDIGLVSGNLVKAINELKLNQVQLSRVTGKFTKELARGVAVQDAFGDAIDFGYRQQNQINESQRKSRADKEVAPKSVAERRQAVADAKAARLASQPTGTKFGPRVSPVYNQGQYRDSNIGPMTPPPATRYPIPKVTKVVRPPLRDQDLPLIDFGGPGQQASSAFDTPEQSFASQIAEKNKKAAERAKRRAAARKDTQAARRAYGERQGFFDSSLFDNFQDPNQAAAFQAGDQRRKSERFESNKKTTLGRASNLLSAGSDKFSAIAPGLSNAAFGAAVGVPYLLGDSPGTRGFSAAAGGLAAGAQFGPVGAVVGAVIGGLQGLATYLNDTEIERATKSLTKSFESVDKAFEEFTRNSDFEAFSTAFAKLGKSIGDEGLAKARREEFGTVGANFGPGASVYASNPFAKFTDAFNKGLNALTGSQFDTNKFATAEKEAFKRGSDSIREANAPASEKVRQVIASQIEKEQLQFGEFRDKARGDENFNQQLKTIFLASASEAAEQYRQDLLQVAGDEKQRKFVEGTLDTRVALELSKGDKGTFAVEKGETDFVATQKRLKEQEQNAAAIFDQLGRRVELVAASVENLSNKLGEFGEQASYIAASVGGGGVRSFTASRVNVKDQGQLNSLVKGLGKDPISADFKNAVASRDFIENKLPDILKKSELNPLRPNDSDPFSKVEAAITEGLGRDNPLKDILQKQLKERFFTVEAGTETKRTNVGEKEFLNTVGNITGELVPITEKIIENFLAVRDVTAKFANEYGNVLNQQQQLLLSAEQKRVDAATFIAEQSVDLKSKQGRNISIEELSAGRSARLAGLGAGGNTTPDDLKARILGAQTARAGVEADQQRRINSGDTSPENVAAIEKNTQLLSSIDTGLQKNTKALEVMATDTSRLAAINQKLGERAARREQFQGTLEGIATAGPEGLAEITKQFKGALAFVQNGQVGRRPEDLSSQLAGLRALGPVFAANNPNFNQKDTELGLIKQYLTQNGLTKGIQAGGGDVDAFAKAFLDSQDTSDPNQILLGLRQEAIEVISSAQTAQAQILERAAANTALIAPQIKAGFDAGIAAISENLKPLASQVNRIDVTGNVTVNATGGVRGESGVGATGGRNGPIGFAAGRVGIAGPGGPKDDKIPAMLSKGESVMTAKVTQENFALLSHLAAGGKVEKFAKGTLFDKFTRGAVDFGLEAVQAPLSVPYEAAQNLNGTRARQKAAAEARKKSIAEIAQLQTRNTANPYANREAVTAKRKKEREAMQKYEADKARKDSERAAQTERARASVESQSDAFEASQARAMAEYEASPDARAYSAVRSVTPEQKLAGVSDAELQTRFAAAQRQQTQKPLTGYKKQEQKRPVSLDLRGPSYLAQEGQNGRYAPKAEGKAAIEARNVAANPGYKDPSKSRYAPKLSGTFSTDALEQRNIAANPGYNPGSSRYAPREEQQFGTSNEQHVENVKRRNDAANPITSGFAKRGVTEAQKIEDAKRYSSPVRANGRTDYQNQIQAQKVQHNADGSRVVNKYSSLGERLQAQEDKRAAFSGQTAPVAAPQQASAAPRTGVTPPPAVSRGVTVGASGPSTASKQGENSTGAAPDLQKFNDSFAASVANLDKMIARLEAVKITGKIEVSGTHKVEVIHNGADIFKALDGSITKMILDKVGAAFGKIFNSDGTAKNDKLN